MNETDQDRDDKDAAMFYADLVAFQQQAEEALKASLSRPLQPVEVAAIAWLAHIPMNHDRS